MQQKIYFQCLHLIMKNKYFFCAMLLLQSSILFSQSNMTLSRLAALGDDVREWSQDAIQDKNGNLLVTAITYGHPDFDLGNGVYQNLNVVPGSFIAKYDQQLNLKWVKHANKNTAGLAFHKLFSCPNNDFIVTGNYYGTADLDLDSGTFSYTIPSPLPEGIFIARYDSNGVLKSHHEMIPISDSINWIEPNFIYDATIDTSNNVIVAGYAGKKNLIDGQTIPECSFFVLKFDSTMNLIFSNYIKKGVAEFHNWSSWRMPVVQTDLSGNIFLSMSFNDSIDIDLSTQQQFATALPLAYINCCGQPPYESNNFDVICIKYDSNGNLIDHKIFNGFGGTSSQRLIDFQIYRNELYMVCVYNNEISSDDIYQQSSDSILERNLLLIKMDNDLNIVARSNGYSNILDPTQQYKALAIDECGNVFFNLNEFEVDVFPEAPFTQQGFQKYHREFVFALDDALNVKDSVKIGKQYSQNYFPVAGYNQLFVFGVFWDSLKIGNYTIHENIPSGAQHEGDCYIAAIKYDGCTKREPVNHMLELPNVFTPGNDNNNDFFEAMKIENINVHSLKIFNRWGKEVFTNTELKWSGLNNDQLACSDGVYYYVLEYDAYEGLKKAAGTVTLIRE